MDVDAAMPVDFQSIVHGNETALRSRRVASILDIPPEIFEAIVEEMDKATLRSCYAVCTSWWMIIRPHLFSTIRIRDPRQLAQFVRHLELHPDVGRRTQRLELNGSQSRAGFPISSTIILGAVRGLPRLNDLTIVDAVWDDMQIGAEYGPSEDTYCVNESRFSGCTLRRLHLRCLEYKVSIGSLIRFLSLFHIDDLSLFYVADLRDEMPLLADGPLVIRDIYIHTDPQTILPHLASVLALGTVASLSCGWIDAWQSQSIGDFLLRHGPSLSGLSLSTEFMVDTMKRTEAQGTLNRAITRIHDG